MHVPGVRYQERLFEIGQEGVQLTDRPNEKGLDKLPMTPPADEAEGCFGLGPGSVHLPVHLGAFRGVGVLFGNVQALKPQNQETFRFSPSLGT